MSEILMSVEHHMVTLSKTVRAWYSHNGRQYRAEMVIPDYCVGTSSERYAMRMFRKSARIGFAAQMLTGINNVYDAVASADKDALDRKMRSIKIRRADN